MKKEKESISYYCYISSAMLSFVNALINPFEEESRYYPIVQVCLGMVFLGLAAMSKKKNSKKQA